MAGDNPFQSGGERYAAFRPTYPAGLATALASLSPGSDHALDIGCGSGQLTALLAPHFREVIGIDPSASQLAHAEPVANVIYREAAAEDTGLAAGTVDLITVAQAAHWFDLPAFYEEVRRVARDGAAIALVSYGVPYIEDAVNTVFQQGYWQDIHAFWPQQRAHVETAYAELEFPFPALTVPAQACRRSLGAGQFIDYMRTWSAYKKACELGRQDAFQRFFGRLSRAWPGEARREVVWPISVKAGRVQHAAA